MALQGLAWLAGDWRGEGEHATLEEHYSTAVGSTILGTSREVRNGVSVHREFLLFEEDGEGLRLTVIIPGQREILFSRQGVEEGAHVFETLATPRQRLLFRPLGSDGMHIRLEKSDSACDFRLARVG